MSVSKGSDRRCTTVRQARDGDLPAVRELLQDAGLPIDGVADWLPHFRLAEHEGEIVAVAGLEMYGPSALLRSVAVRPDWRGSGVGRLLVDDLLSDAKSRGTHDVFLLTTTAEHYFPRLGFTCIRREDVPERVRASVEFTSACPASAVVMQKPLSQLR